MKNNYKMTFPDIPCHELSRSKEEEESNVPNKSNFNEQKSKMRNSVH